MKTYSQGMRQRLGLARVLLGRPEVLVLDEPTNGLDPGEMREVRQLVHRVADAGATVLFSSHVLAEVEQICTHAVVMDKGKLVASGSVAELIGSSGSVYLEVDDVARRTPGPPALPTVTRVDDEPPGLTVVTTAARGPTSSPRWCKPASASRRSRPGAGSRTPSSGWWKATGCERRPHRSRSRRRAGSAPTSRSPSSS